MRLWPGVRVLAATNKSLSQLVHDGQFREDLFYRIHVIHMKIPPLRERREDK
ncbi:MAG: sigma 54-interacting transcriptional regulator [Terracidiphilus sp.]|nr:sigma 54-interacting transcriptional regulator [Terracidiphilus sp.]